MTTYQLTIEDQKALYANRVFVKLGTEIYLLATPTEKGHFFCTSSFAYLSSSRVVVEGLLTEYPFYKNHVSRYVKKNM